MVFEGGAESALGGIGQPIGYLLYGKPLPQVRNGGLHFQACVIFHYTHTGIPGEDQLDIGYAHVQLLGNFRKGQTGMNIFCQKGCDLLIFRAEIPVGTGIT